MTRMKSTKGQTMIYKSMPQKTNDWAVKTAGKLRCIRMV